MGIFVVMMFVYAVIMTCLYSVAIDDKDHYKRLWRYKYKVPVDKELDEAILNALQNEADNISGDGEVDAYNEIMLRRFKRIKERKQK